MLKRLVPINLETVIRTNKTDYPTFQKALSYVQNTLQRHYEQSHPTPMDIGTLQQQQDHSKHVTFEDDVNTKTAEHEHLTEDNDHEHNDHSVDSSSSWGWNEDGTFWIDSVGSKGGKPSKSKGKGFIPHSDRQCFNCGETGHIAANCNSKGKGKSCFKGGGGKFGNKGGKGLGW